MVSKKLIHVEQSWSWVASPPRFQLRDRDRRLFYLCRRSRLAPQAFTPGANLPPRYLCNSRLTV